MSKPTTIPTYAELQEAVTRTDALLTLATAAYAPYQQARWALIDLRTILTGNAAAVAQVNAMIRALNALAAPGRTAYHDAAEAADAAKAEQLAWGTR